MRDVLFLIRIFFNLCKYFSLVFQSVNKESIIDLHANVVAVSSKIESCSVQNVEVSVLEIYLVSAAKPQLPLQIEDASRPEKTNVNNSDKIIAMKMCVKISFVFF